MRKGLILWCSVLAAGVILHFKFGPALLRRDAIAAQIETAQKAMKSQDLASAESAYQHAIGLLDRRRSDAALAAQLTLELEKVRASRSGLIGAIEHLEQILDDSRGRGPLPPAVELEIRSELARMHYQAAWLLRMLEAPPSYWMHQAELARQEFAAAANGATDAAQREKAIHNTQAAIRLARMENWRYPLPESSDLENGNQQLVQQLNQKKNAQSRSASKRPGDSDGLDPSPAPSGGVGGRNTTGS